MNNYNRDFEYTPEEIKALENAMKQKEFRDLLAEYVEEISDPKNKAEYDQYLKQLESQQELPKGMKLIQPTACFCLKTKIKDKKDPKNSQKIFINVCMAPDLEKPTQEKDKKDSVKGQQWHIPYSVGKIRMDQDKHKNVCRTVDIAFNPLTFEYCRRTEAFKKMICEISVEAASKMIKDPNESVSKDYKILNRLKCKGGQPAVMPVRLDAKLGEQDQNRPSGQRNEDHAPKLFQEFVKQQKDFKDTQAKDALEKLEKNAGIVELESKTFETIQEKPGQEEEETSTTKQIIAPKYKILHSYGVEYSDFLMNPPEKGKKVPKQLIVKIEVPRVEKLKELDLDINEKSLVLKATKKYYLDIALPYKIDSEAGSAKFDSKTKTLTVTLPTVPVEDKENLDVKQVEEIETIDGKAEKTEDENKEDETRDQTNTEERDDISNNQSMLKFVTEESQRKYKEEQEKLIERVGAEGNENLVEEIEAPQAEPTKKENKPEKNEAKEIKKVVDTNFEFKTQQTFENYFFIFNVPGYEKERAKVGLLDEEVLFSYEDEKRGYISWLKLEKGYDKKASQVNFVKDYIVVNLKKAQDGFWEEGDWRKQAYNEEFWSKLKAYEEEKKNEPAQESKPQEGVKDGEEAKPEEKQEDKDGKQEEEEEEEDTEREVGNKKEPQNIEERFVEKRSINFINYDRSSFVFQLD